MAKVWLITGCSSGFGQEIALAAMAAGDRVVATARDPSKLSSLSAKGALIVALDVLWPDEKLAAAISDIVAQTSGIDVLVNNAGYILTGGVEECSHAEVEAQFQTNVFGQLNVARAVLPHMRAARAGVVANLGSVGGWRGTPAAGLYCATKACAALLSEALRSEVAHLGIKVTCIEPGYFRTNFLSGGHRVQAANKIPELAEGVGKTHSAFDSYDRKQPGDPVKGAALIVDALTGRGSCAGRELPPRLLIGRDAFESVVGVMDAQRAVMEEWKDLTTVTDCDD